MAERVNPWLYGAAVIFVAMTLIWPFTQALYLPLIDLPNHIARHTIMATGNEGALATYYTSNFVLVPNSAVDLLWQVFGGVDAVVFSHRVMTFTAVNFFAAGLVLAYAIHGRLTWWSLAAGLLAFHCTFLFGFQNYSFSLPFAIYAFALFLVTEARPLWQRAIIFAVIAPVLFLMHFFAFAVLGAMAFGREAQKVLEAQGRRGAQLASCGVMALPFLIPVIWLLISLATGPENPAGSYTEFGDLSDRLFRRWLTPLTSFASDLTPEMNVVALYITLGLLAAAASVLLPERYSIGFRLAPAMRGPVLMLLAAVLLAPNWLSGVALIHIRFPFVFLLVMVAASTFRGRNMTFVAVAMALMLGATGLRGAQMGAWFAKSDAEMRQLVGLFEETLEPGDRLLPVRAPGLWTEKRHSHAQGYAVAVSEAFIPTLFQGVHAVQLKPEWVDHADPLATANPACGLFAAVENEAGGDCYVVPYLEAWSEKFTKVIAFEPLDPVIVADAPLERIGERGRYQVYRVLN
ncbi:MAG: hypothetical protein AAGI10_00640 [Pseudomonadota bacterium]